MYLENITIFLKISEQSFTSSVFIKRSFQSNLKKIMQSVHVYIRNKCAKNLKTGSKHNKANLKIIDIDFLFKCKRKNHLHRR